MDLEPLLATKSFDKLEYGAVFLTDMDGHEVVRAIKAFVKLRDGQRRDDLIVTIGPFLKHDGNVPNARDPKMLGVRPVIDLSTLCKLSPSHNVDDVVLQLPPFRRSQGMVFVEEDRVMLVVKSLSTGGQDSTGLLDIGSGEVTFPSGINQDLVFAIRRWSLISSDKDHKVLFEHYVPVVSE